MDSKLYIMGHVFEGRLIKRMYCYKILLSLEKYSELLELLFKNFKNAFLQFLIVYIFKQSCHFMVI